MDLNEYLNQCEEEIYCKYCHKKIKWLATYGWVIWPKEMVSVHEKECEENPNSPSGLLLRDIAKCKTQARISECLNCQHYQEKCTGTEQ